MDLQNPRRGASAEPHDTPREVLGLRAQLNVLDRDAGAVRLELFSATVSHTIFYVRITSPNDLLVGREQAISWPLAPFESCRMKPSKRASVGSSLV